ncbi:MAG: response regulator [Roseofilum sp. SID2]|uniref:response regulator n=2 Tax=Roseofilum TaxID=1233426 RepID=UPI001B0C2EFB|nr:MULTISPECIES: response regulator [unclassified Roseofilum]MBP0012401.1 response regulator [Roseofilum sp. SID3]MBP0023412.1 response regulator [Roseofilum sp. SID2]MBP0038716.1 response regulator [Roseofilum sp. SID1]
MSMSRRKKPKMLVVDDEPDNLDLLYRTFRREFQVSKAESGADALNVLATEGEVAVIISDQRMPQMKGTEFLSQTVEQYPNTMRIILTGFTDVEDLVEAINSGQVYKYITKPWDPTELKGVVDRAAQTYDLLKQRTEELEACESQTLLLSTLVKLTEESQELETALRAIAEVFAQAFETQGCILQIIKDGGFASPVGRYSSTDELLDLSTDALTQEALSSATLQYSELADGPIKAHLAMPIYYQQKLLALLSLQWTQAYNLSEEEKNSIHTSAQLVGLLIAAMG